MLNENKISEIRIIITGLLKDLDSLSENEMISHIKWEELLMSASLISQKLNTLRIEQERNNMKRYLLREDALDIMKSQNEQIIRLTKELHEIRSKSVLRSADGEGDIREDERLSEKREDEIDVVDREEEQINIVDRTGVVTDNIAKEGSVMQEDVPAEDAEQDDAKQEGVLQEDAEQDDVLQEDVVAEDAKHEDAEQEDVLRDDAEQEDFEQDDVEGEETRIAPEYEIDENIAEESRAAERPERDFDNDRFELQDGDEFPWMTDKTGPPVDDIRDAVTLNDKLCFIGELFEDDSEQYKLTMNRLNEMGSFGEALSYLRRAFPDWDESSAEVYRFYMIVRRRYDA